MRDLFELFRKDVLALDPCVTEEFLKRYVAYKAETNFVDIVPQKSRLCLLLNMQFHELHDPKGHCVGVTRSFALVNCLEYQLQSVKRGSLST